MKFRYYKVQLLSVLAFALMAISCTEEWDNHYQEKALNKSSLNLYQYIQSRSELSKFAQMLAITGYDSILSQAQAYTVWAPNNAALEGVDLLDSADVDKIVRNHITWFTHTTSGVTSKSVLMANSKLVEFARGGSGYTFGGKTIVEADLAMANGIIHILGNYSPYKSNIWEYISKTPGLDSLYAYINSLTMQELDLEKSYQQGVFVDFFYKETNRYFTYVGKLGQEDSTYTAVLPTNAAWNEAYNAIFPYFNTLPKDGGIEKQVEYTKWSLVSDLVFNGKVTTPVIKDTLISTWGNIFLQPGRLFDNAQPVEMSNGVGYVTDNLKSKATETWLNKIKVEAENTSYGRITSNYAASVVSGLGTGFNISGRNYLTLVPTTSSSISKLFVHFPVPNTLASKYNIYCVFVPAAAVDTTDKKPYKVRYYLSYINAAGTQVANASVDASNKVQLPSQASAIFTTNPTKLDTMLVARDFQFPYTNIVDSRNLDLKKITVALRVENATGTTSAEITNFSRTVRIDCVIFEPVQ